MKTKLILLALLLIGGLNHAFAFKVVLSGGGLNNQYNYVRLSNISLTCAGTGYNYCPIDKITAIKNIRMASPSEIQEKVFSLYESGKDNGETEFEGPVKVSWWTDKDLNLNIEMNFPEDAFQISEDLLKAYSENDGK